MKQQTTLVVSPQGRTRAVYDEAFDFATLGQVSIRRASHVEPTAQGQWSADLRPVGGPVLGPFAKRSQAIAAELAWLDSHLHELPE